MHSCSSTDLIDPADYSAAMLGRIFRLCLPLRHDSHSGRHGGPGYGDHSVNQGAMTFVVMLYKYEALRHPNPRIVCQHSIQLKTRARTFIPQVNISKYSNNHAAKMSSNNNPGNFANRPTEEVRAIASKGGQASGGGSSGGGGSSDNASESGGSGKQGFASSKFSS